ncbi:hypothetical protein ADK38_22815, partial [Streptomyces varsoviensis]
RCGGTSAPAGSLVAYPRRPRVHHQRIQHVQHVQYVRQSEQGAVLAAATLHTGRVEVADTARGVGGLAADDWAEAVAVTTGGSSLSPRSPEQWARSVFEDAPGPVRWFLVTGWRSV